jgi:two-component system chemotaxis sensor kinase CheA
MDKEQLIQRLMATFLGELDEHARALNRDLLALEKDPRGTERAELCKTLFRTAHSLKGAARSVSLGPIETACHRLEGILAEVRDGLFTPGPDLFQLMFATVDAIEAAGQRLREGQPLDGTLPALAARLETARRAVPATATAPAPAPTNGHGRREPEPPPVVGEPRDGTGVPGAAARVRIPAAKLDALLAAVGELLVASRRLEPRGEELETLLQELGRWQAEWRRAERPIHRALGLADGVRAAKAAGADAAPLPRRIARVGGQVGEHLDHAVRALEALVAGHRADRQALQRALAPLDEEVRRIRMLPFAEACEGLDRAARDLARDTGKEAEVEIRGAEIELDRSILEALRDPLLHLLRNAVDHGIETPAERAAAGKGPRGRVTVEAALQGDRVRVTVTDDGRGLDLAAIRDLAARRGLPAPADERDACRLLFLPGFSTARMITELSGRGVGLDVVKTRIESLHGLVTCRVDRGPGLAVVLDVPLTLTTVRAVLVTVSGQTYAVPQAHVEGLLRIAPEEARSVEGREVVGLGGPPVPLVSLAHLLGLPARPLPPGARSSALLLASGERRVAFSVDELLAEQDVVVTNLGSRLRRVLHFSGATLLPSGRVALILNVGDLVRSALSRPAGPSLADQVATRRAEPRRLLVVDDSVTTRTLVKSILEGDGYAVQAAADGAEAWQLLQERGADLVVSDVEMPRMDGFDLTATIRRSARFRHLPVILVTALESEEDRMRGMEAGADAYLMKSAFDQTRLLETVHQLIPDTPEPTPDLPRPPPAGPS